MVHVTVFELLFYVFIEIWGIGLFRCETELEIKFGLGTKREHKIQEYQNFPLSRKVCTLFRKMTVSKKYKARYATHYNGFTYSQRNLLREYTSVLIKYF